MTNPKSAMLVMLIDRSGSMKSVRNATIEGITTVLDVNAQLVKTGTLDEVICYIAQFDTTPYSHQSKEFDVFRSVYPIDDGYEVLVNFKPLDWAKLPDLSDYLPRGVTALYDSICFTIDEVGKYLSSLPEEQRPGKVHMMINTDGMDNASQICTAAKSKHMIEHQTDTYGWEFSFYGSNKESVLEAEQKMGIRQSVYYESVNTRSTYGAASKSISRSFGG
jgi:hypothetical protein